jgi:hypothetical protein
MKYPTQLVTLAAISFLIGAFFITAYENIQHYDTSYTVRVPSYCVLNAVAAGEDFLFSCPR